MAWNLHSPCRGVYDPIENRIQIFGRRNCMGMSFRSRFAVLALALGVSVGVMGQGAMAAKVGNIDVSGYVDVYGAFNMNTPAVIGTPFHLFEPAEGAAL